MISKECLYCLKNDDDREIIQAGGHGIRMKLMNEDNKWWIYAHSIKAWEEQKDIYHAPIIRIENEFNEEVQIKYCPWCGRKL